MRHQLTPLAARTGRSARRNHSLMYSTFLLLAGAALGPIAHAQEASSPLALSHIAPAQASARLLGRSDSARTLSLTLVLPLRNRAGLEDRLRRVADPHDALYGHYLTPEEFDAEFGPNQADVDVVAAFAEQHGLTVRDAAPGGTLVHVSGPVGAVESAFGVHLNDYAGKDGRTFFGPDRQPTVPTALAGRLLSILGLSNAAKAHPFSRQAPATPLLDYYTGNAGLSPADVKSIYSLTGSAYTGKGQLAAVYEEGTYTPSDISTYFSTYKISIPVKAVSVDGYNTNSTPGGAAGEVTLDIDLLAALSPNLSGIRVYENDDTNTVPFPQQLVDTFTAMAKEPAATRPTVISVSYGESEIYESASDFNALDQAAAQLASQGQTVCVSSGDAGAYTDQTTTTPNASFPADSPHVLCVGGTDLTDSIDNNNVVHYVSETSWADPSDTGRGPIGTGGGGGVSSYFAIPSYQVGSFSKTTNPQGSTTMRNLPDVSLYGDYDTGGYDIYFSDPTYGPGFYGFNGTSASSPLWASFLAGVNQARLANGLPLIGLSNTPIYQAAEAHYAADFHDIADGSTNLYYHAVKGYDNSTGWGSFIGSHLLTDLSTVAATASLSSLSFSPSTVTSGSTTTGTVTLTSAAPAGGAAVSITLNGAAVTTVTVPAGQTSATFSLTAPTVTATTTYTYSAAYSGKTVTATLTVSPAGVAPKVTKFSPGSGPVGTTVILTGVNLTGATSVTFNGVSASFTVNSATQITTVVPAGAKTGKISVTTPNGTATPGVNFTVTGSAAAPTISTFSPTSGPVGGTTTITGTNLSGTTGVSFHGTAATAFTVNSSTSVTAEVPAGATSGTLTITTPGGTATSTASFTVTSSSSATLNSLSFNPSAVTSGSTTTGTVTLSGPAPTGGAAVAITQGGAAVATVTVAAGQTSASFSLTAPTVTATTTYTYSAAYNGTTVTAALTVNPAGAAPKVTKFSPGSGPVGTTVILTGVNLTGATSVTFNGVSASFTVNSATQITTVVPAGAKTGKISVTTPNGTATPGVNFTVTSSTLAVTALSFNPSPAYSSGTTTGTVTLSGPAPTGGAAVTISQIVNGSSTVLGTVTVPAGSTGVSFTLTLPTVTASTVLTFSAAYGGTTINTNLTVNPTSVTLSGFMLSPNPVTSGGDLTGTVELSAPAPAGGAVVTITLNGATQGRITIVAGNSSGGFNLVAPTVSASTVYTYGAAYNGASLTTNETVNP